MQPPSDAALGPFADRADAGRRLARALWGYAGRPDVLVLALPRGGVPVGVEVARALGVPLDVLVIRKLGAPGQDELAMGAIAAGLRVLNPDVVEALGIAPADIDRVEARERAELERRERAYRGGRPPPQVRGRTVLLVDDGMATGATMRAALRLLRTREPAALVVAVPTAAPETLEELRAEADDVVAVLSPSPFGAISLWYRSFPQLDDSEVRRLLEAPGAPVREAAPGEDGDTRVR